MKIASFPPNHFLLSAANLASRSVNLDSSVPLSACFAFSFSLTEGCASFAFLTVPSAVEMSLSDFVAADVSLDRIGSGSGPSAAA